MKLKIPDHIRFIILNGEYSISEKLDIIHASLFNTERERDVIRETTKMFSLPVAVILRDEEKLYYSEGIDRSVESEIIGFNELSVVKNTTEENKVNSKTEIRRFINSIKIGCRKYTVEYDSNLVRDGKERYGWIEYGTHRMVIHDKFCEAKQTEALVHESLHAMDDLGDVELTEGQTTVLAPIIMAFIQENPLLIAKIQALQ